jgi:hypothetical protein
MPAERSNGKLTIVAQIDSWSSLWQYTHCETHVALLLLYQGVIFDWGITEQTQFWIVATLLGVLGDEDKTNPDSYTKHVYACNDTRLVRNTLMS